MNLFGKFKVIVGAAVSEKWAEEIQADAYAEDAIDAVPKGYRDGALAMGATHWQTIWRVVMPAARSGVIMAVMLGIGRAIGETMAVMMVTGNAARIPREWYALFLPARTMTATIAAEMGEVAQGSTHYHVLFAVGILLFLVTFIINAIAWCFIGIHPHVICQIFMGVVDSCIQDSDDYLIVLGLQMPGLGCVDIGVWSASGLPGIMQASL